MGDHRRHRFCVGGGVGAGRLCGQLVLVARFGWDQADPENPGAGGRVCGRCGRLLAGDVAHWSPRVHDRALFAGLLALGAAAAAGWAVWTYGAVPTRRYRVVRAFEGLAAQVLGHTGNPIAGAVKAFDWKTANGREWPGTLTAVVGPGFSDTPTEHAGLNRAARQMGWPSYQWSYDPMRKRVVGTAVAVSGRGPSVAKSVEE
ncbi:hypothetical protein ACNQPY_26300 [Mycobacteroides abscessus]|uniref:hypothetical protein n=1 Tax=Mycobacteroides abscessus TaxID=36809 RepID=UPI003AAFB308